MRHPGVSGALWDLFETAGVTVLDHVEERSVWRSLETLDRTIGLEVSVEHAVHAGRIGHTDGPLGRRAARAAVPHGEFYATMPKVLVVGQKR